MEGQENSFDQKCVDKENQGIASNMADKNNSFASKKSAQAGEGKKIGVKREGPENQHRVSIQPLHQGENTAARAAIPHHIRIPSNAKPRGRGNSDRGRPSSPTDTMLSPVSQKIHKRRKTLAPKEPAKKNLQLDSENTASGRSGTNRNIVLCTPSGSRRAILGQMGYSFTSMSDGIDDASCISSNPVSFTLNVAHEKINAVMNKVQQPSVLIATHQVVNPKANSGVASNVAPRQAFSRRGEDNKIRVRRSENARDKVMGSPSDTGEAKEMLKSQSNSMSEVLSAVVVVDTETGKRCEALDVAWVHFYEIPEKELDEIVSYTEERGVWQDNLLSCPGAVCVEHPKLAGYIKNVEGVSEALKGLPWESTAALLRMVGSPSPVASPKASVKASVAVSVAAHDAHGQQGGPNLVDE
eukprot:gb/GECG01005733.1/.p1 GENE.gb/GECG01005733.1/~~gb/GECG01005733.1/.p1  ORF type:complete len:412 (+),score=53.93 gb/GECG01005733.1/:1-1236(+)